MVCYLSLGQEIWDLQSRDRILIVVQWRFLKRWILRYDIIDEQGFHFDRRNSTAKHDHRYRKYIWSWGIVNSLYIQKRMEKKKKKKEGRRVIKTRKGMVSKEVEGSKTCVVTVPMTSRRRNVSYLFREHRGNEAEGILYSHLISMRGVKREE